MRYSIFCMLTAVVLLCVFDSIGAKRADENQSKPIKATGTEKPSKEDKEGNFVTGEGRGCHCSKTRRFVCGSDGKTYRNQCVFKCVQKNEPSLKRGSPGACESDESLRSSDEVGKSKEDSDLRSSDEDAFVDGHDSSDEVKQKHKSEEHAVETGNFALLGDGHADHPEEKKKDCRCKETKKSVCASDDKSYKSVCHMNCQSEDKDVFVKHEGKCNKDDSLEHTKKEEDHTDDHETKGHQYVKVGKVVPETKG